MKYSNRYDKKPFTIEEEPRDNEELPDADIDNIDTAFKEGGRVDIKIDQNATEEEDTPKTPSI